LVIPALLKARKYGAERVCEMSALKKSTMSEVNIKQQQLHDPKLETMMDYFLEDKD
jgi:hypothetical protein